MIYFDIEKVYLTRWRFGMAGVLFSLLPRGERGGVFSSYLGIPAGISGTLFFTLAALSAARRILPAASLACEFLRILSLTMFWVLAMFPQLFWA